MRLHMFPELLVSLDVLLKLLFVQLKAPFQSLPGFATPELQAASQLGSLSSHHQTKCKRLRSLSHSVVSVGLPPLENSSCPLCASPVRGH